MMKVFARMAGVVLIAAMPAAVFTQVDTSGIGTWNQMYNSSASWEDGAFGANALGHPDYGWGIYNSISHGLTGDSLFVIKLQDGSYRKLWIVDKDANQNYTFRYAMLDGSDPHEVMLNTNDYSSKQFVLYSLANNVVVDQQPDASEWDLLLTKFQHVGLNYIVTGFLGNDGVTVSVLNAADSAAAAAATLADTTEFTDSIAAIGNSWYELQGMSIVPLDSMAYYVKTGAGDIYKLQVTYFESGYSGLGRVGIRKQKLTETPDPDFIPDTLVMGSFYANEVFYGLGSMNAVATPRDTWEIGFKTGVFTSSIIANTTMGVELYTYPYGDTAAWDDQTSVLYPGESSSGISLYPVPAGNEVFIHHDFRTSENLEVNLYDMSGRLIREFRVSPDGNADIRLDLNGIRPGVYLLQMNGPEVRAVSRITIK